MLVAGAARAFWREPSGGIEELDPAGARARWRRGSAPLLCHAPGVARRLGADVAPPAFDILELWAFVRPARFCVPTPRGLAQALGLEEPRDPVGQLPLLRRAAERLLAELAGLTGRRRDAALPAAAAMAAEGWIWGAEVAAALGLDAGAGASLDAWSALEEWQEVPPRPASGHRPVSEAETRERLAALLRGGAEARPQQADYAAALTPAFAPRQREGEPRAVVAEAGTGVGKTLGYIAPAGLWAAENGGAVWISTFTRNLQRQVDRELDRPYPERAAKSRRVVVRKGRENYLCLLNFVEAVGGRSPHEAVFLGLVARWIGATRDGDMSGGDFPGWLAELFGADRSLGLADRRGECVHAACPQYRRCFVERSIRRARRADLVVANHALVLLQATLGDDPRATHPLPTRYVFDEGHHLFDAADSVFSAHITGREGAELRRWLLGSEDRRGRARGLARRLDDLPDEAVRNELGACLEAARCLPGQGWHRRLAEGGPRGPAERFLALVRAQLLARAHRPDSEYGLECPKEPVLEGLLDRAAELERALEALARPLAALRRELLATLDREADRLESAARLRMEAVTRGIERRGLLQLGAWRAMLAELGRDTPEDFVDLFALERRRGVEVDVGMHRHWKDPGLPFAREVASKAHGLVVTSATLRDSASTGEEGWTTAHMRTGLRHLASPPAEFEVASPFDYAALTRILVLVDIDKNDAAQTAAAMRELFLAAGGGALGLFTAIARLREVHRRIAEAMERSGLALYAQHVDAMDTGTLVDVFRAERDACLLGTDAVRDGIDVPGRSLRLVVFDRVPWPRPDLLHRARRGVFGGSRYDDMLARLRLRQAFGRLVRRADDRGVFVMLDSALPSRLAAAFPSEVPVERMGLAGAVDSVRGHLRRSG